MRVDVGVGYVTINLQSFMAAVIIAVCIVGSVVSVPGRQCNVQFIAILVVKDKGGSVGCIDSVAVSVSVARGGHLAVGEASVIA